MKIKKTLLILLALAVLLCGCDKYTKSQLAEYEKKVTDASPISEEEGLQGVLVTEYKKKLCFTVILKEPIVPGEFVKYCQVFNEIMPGAVDNDMEKLYDFSVSLYRDGKLVFGWTTDDLKSGYMFDYRNKEPIMKELVFENGKPEIKIIVPKGTTP